jgi:hypothetical protein
VNLVITSTKAYGRMLHINGEKAKALHVDPGSGFSMLMHVLGEYRS